MPALSYLAAPRHATCAPPAGSPRPRRPAAPAPRRRLTVPPLRGNAAPPPDDPVARLAALAPGPLARAALASPRPGPCRLRPGLPSGHRLWVLQPGLALRLGRRTSKAPARSTTTQTHAAPPPGDPGARLAAPAPGPPARAALASPRLGPCRLGPGLLDTPAPGRRYSTRPPVRQSPCSPYHDADSCRFAAG